MTEDTDVAEKPKRGWSSTDLQVVRTDDPHYWSVADAASLLGPPELKESQVRQLIRLANLTPAGKRFAGSRRRHVRVYHTDQLIEAYEKVATLSGLTGD